jgi:hypothetical protein
MNSVAAPGLKAFAGGWEAHRHRHCIWVVTPNGYEHAHTFDELAAALSEAFRELGGSAPIVRRRAQFDGRTPIILGANLIPRSGIPDPPEGSIIYNLEQLTSGSLWMFDDYRGLLSRYPVLDYSRRNQAALHEAGFPHVGLLEIGYSPVLRQIEPLPKDFDILFYGSTNKRRNAVLRDLVARGFDVASAFGVYGQQRDELIARSRLVINLHYYEANIFEIVRVSYLLANGVCVVAEGHADDPDLTGLAAGLELAPYDELADRCEALLRDEARRQALECAAFAAISGRRQSDLLRACIERTA